VARGRAVYVAEGCIHCHSQFVRPGSRDERLWGPARPLDRREQPPLIGNRRQGPDLSAVGLRRSPLWNRLHLMDPRSLTPASRMPAYAHLFAPGDRRGDDLVEYLAALGAGGGAARLAQISPPDAPTSSSPAIDSPSPADQRTGADRFDELCAACHGAAGRGDGPLASHFAPPALDLAKPHLTHVPDRADGSRDLAGLARLIRWGVPGTAMAGHEALSDAEIAALAARVASFRPAGPADRSPGGQP
jgi:cytochrome c oxidase cbb3-type subunit 2